MTINQLLQNAPERHHAICRLPAQRHQSMAVSRWKKRDHEPLPETLELFEQAARDSRRARADPGETETLPAAGR